MKQYIVLLFFVLALCCACSVRTPEVQVTGQKTALENQILGAYQQIEDDSYMVASTRSGTGDKKVVLADEKQKVLDAVQSRKFNNDDIVEFKQDGAVGENNQGFLVLRMLPRLDSDPEYRELVQQIVDEENRDRKIIYDRVLEINPDANKAGQEKVYAVFAKLNKDSSEKGTWIQLTDGTWTKKTSTIE